jgi:hypothetical protein
MNKLITFKLISNYNLDLHSLQERVIRYVIRLSIWYVWKFHCDSKTCAYLNTTPWRRTREWWYSATILNIETRWRWVVNFTPPAAPPQGKNPRYPFDKILGRLYEEVKTFCPSLVAILSYLRLWCRNNSLLFLYYIYRKSFNCLKVGKNLKYYSDREHVLKAVKCLCIWSLIQFTAYALYPFLCFFTSVQIVQNSYR